MTRKDDRDRVAVHDRPDCPGRPRLPDLRREGTVGRDLAEGDASKLLQNGAPEVSGQSKVDLELEALALALEVLVELPCDVVDRARRAKDARAETPRQPLGPEIGVDLIGDNAEPAVRHPDEELADGRLEHVIGDVKVAGFGRGFAETAVELGRDGGHDWLLLSRRRRTPEEAAWRAASSEDPSAAAILS